MHIKACIRKLQTSQGHEIVIQINIDLKGNIFPAIKYKKFKSFDGVYLSSLHNVLPFSQLRIPHAIDVEARKTLNHRIFLFPTHWLIHTQ